MTSTAFLYLLDDFIRPFLCPVLGISFRCITGDFYKFQFVCFVLNKKLNYLSQFKTIVMKCQWYTKNILFEVRNYT